MRQLILLLAVLGYCEHAHAWGERYGKAAVALVDPALSELANWPSRVDGHWVNGNDEFFYQADTVVVNRFLVQCSKLKGTPSKVVIHAGSARRSALWGKWLSP